MRSITNIHHFIFGYGSLICPKSRVVTAPTLAKKVAMPVLVKGVERTWTKRTTRGVTAMGISFSEKGQCVGVLLPVNPAELRQFDEREVGYNRVLLDLDTVHPVPFLDNQHYHGEDTSHKVFLQAKTIGDSRRADSIIKIWTYVQEEAQGPTSDHPIAQSYVDIILRGCLSISERFATEFITTTKGWSRDELDSYTSGDDSLSTDGDESISSDDEDDAVVWWVDDRDDPIYARSDPVYSKKAAPQLDRLLNRFRPHHLAKRQRRRRHKQSILLTKQ